MTRKIILDKFEFEIPSKSKVIGILTESKQLITLIIKPEIPKLV